MPTITFSTEHVPAAERFDRWREELARIHAPVTISRAHAADFHGALRVVDLGLVRLTEMAYTPTRWQRTPELIRQSDPERYYLALHVAGTTVFNQSGRDVLCGGGDLVLYDTSRPFRSWVAGDRAVRVIVAQIPKGLLPSACAGSLLATRLPGREGIGVLLAQFLTRLMADAAHYRPADAVRLQSVLLKLSSALLAHRLEDDPSPTGGTPSLTLAQRLQEYVHRHLRDPRLSPQTIAAAHHISVRYLHRLFREQGLTVASWIRSERLERCRRDLTDPDLYAQPIHTIAAHWGFSRPPSFTRAFRARYGAAPRDYRRRALQAQAAGRRRVRPRTTVHGVHADGDEPHTAPPPADDRQTRVT